MHLEKINKLSYLVRGAIFEVHRHLELGLFEKIYEQALIGELSLAGLSIMSQVHLPVIYKGIHLEMGYRIDILVEDAIIIEIKSVTALSDVHKKQVTTYLKLSGKKLGFLVNFNTAFIDKTNLIRIIH